MLTMCKPANNPYSAPECADSLARAEALVDQFIVWDPDSIEGTSEWDWVKDVCAEGVRMAIDKGWSGICTNNFAQPHFEGLWSDIAWHQEQNARIKRS